MDFIEVYNNVLPLKTCDFVMNLFKSHKNFVKDGGTLSGVDKKFKDSSDLDLIEIKNIYQQKYGKLYLSVSESHMQTIF